MTPLLTAAEAQALLARVPDYRCESQRKAAPELRAAVASLAATVVALSAERDRLALVLAVERGNVAVAGWLPEIHNDTVRWVRDDSQRPGRVCDAVYGEHDGAMNWHWWDRAIDFDGDVMAAHREGCAPTALEAIEAADNAAKENV